MKNIIIDVSENQIRAALLENGKLKEIIIEDKENISCVGNIYVGKVKNILPSQFAFVDIGFPKNAFLHLSDKKQANLYKTLENGTKKLNIKNNDDIIVQVIKDESGEKGANVTTQITFTGNSVVVMKSDEDNKSIGISQKIEDEPTRRRLKKVAENMLEETSGYAVIMRTESACEEDENIIKEFNKYKDICERILEKGKYIKPPSALYKEQSVYIKILKELLNSDIENIIINNAEELIKLKNLKDNYNLGEDKLILYKSEIPIFSEYFIESQIEKALNKKVWLKSGGFLIIEQTEACVVIDINTGKFLGSKSQQQTALKTNLEAVAEIARQLRLRNLSGMIVVDFIDLKDESHRNQLYNAVLKEIKKDRIGVTLCDVTKAGLMVLTRKKIREPLNKIINKKCEHCNGTGEIRR